MVDHGWLTVHVLDHIVEPYQKHGSTMFWGMVQPYGRPWLTMVNHG